MPAMDLDTTARCLAELGNVVRLRIFSLLVRAGDDGLTVGEVRRALEMPASTLAFHLRGLVDTGLVTQERQGREVRCRPDFARLNAAFATFRDECCQGVSVPAPRRGRGAAGASASTGVDTSANASARKRG
jgi:DNA-binding transcriptional ArsR family regulator